MRSEAPRLSPEVFKQQQEIEGLKQTNRRLLRQLEQARTNTKDLVDAVYQAARDAAGTLELLPVPEPPKIGPRNKTPETAIAVVSDLQLGKRTPTYTSAICERRIEEYAGKLTALTTIQRTDHPVDDLRVYMLGDMIESEELFPGQSHRIDASLYRQIVVDGPRILVNFLRTMLTTYKKIHVVCVIGNHGKIGGRVSRNMHPESNGDLMLYRIVQQLLENEPRITWNIPNLEGERAWHAIDVIGDHRFFLYHGDQMTGGGFGGLPYYGFARAINNWAAGVIAGGFKYALAGHWHQAASIPINDRILWINGSTESSNEWLREELKAQCPPSQWALFAHPQHGVTAEYRVWLK